ncbi:hypothetical protein [Zobellia alginiliquefaciens]|uniref:hypothetical protein n=1 Tax=Zobellia alginiliquefaciens TaxID=3032586 RepID=UPI0023E3A80F|nr:hypothetical protein [Zobellia alginiliquefaciens]
MSELIKLKIKSEATTGKTAQKITSHFIEACLNLDCSILEPMIDEDQYFEELDKYRFLASLKQQFDWAIARGATNITMRKGKCEICVIGHSTYEFYGNRAKPEFAYIINTRKNGIRDIFLCNGSSGWSN